MAFVKGKSGNPAGKPSGRKDWDHSCALDVQNALKTILNRKSAAGLIRLHSILEHLCARAESGDIGAAKLVLEYYAGKPRANDSLAVEQQGPITVVLPAWASQRIDTK